MSQHLPECGQQSTAQPYFIGICICDRLRACEKRVERRIIHGGLDAARFNAGLDAAREAVESLDIGRDVRFSADVRADILAVLDALRSKP